MKYKIYLEEEYTDFAGQLEPDRVIECDPEWLEFKLKNYCDDLYSNRDGWEWMKDSDERILAIDESGKMSYYSFEVDYEPVLYVHKTKD